MCQADLPHPEKDPLVDARASGCCSRGQPCMRRNNQGLHTCLQSWVDDRCKTRIVVGRQRIERAILLRLVIYLRIVTAKEPEHRRSVPLRPKASEIFARHRRFSLLYGAVREVLAKRVNDLLCRSDIVCYQGIAVQWSDLRYPRRT